MRALIHLAILSLVLPVFGCDDEPEAPTEPVEEVSTDDEPGSDQLEPGPTGDLMREHFLKVREARQALVGDDIEGARAAMAWLADNDPGLDAVPTPLRPNLEGMREEARSFADATTLSEASMAFAGMLNYCGECHQHVEGGPEFAMPPGPDGDALQDQMQRHRWAIERMWEGIVSRNLETYVDGATVMGDVQLRAEELPHGVLEPERIDAIIAHVHELAGAAKESTDWDDRTENFGRLLATCATCHRALGVGAFARAAMDPAIEEPTEEPTEEAAAE
ncbi:MAG: hypothetical protein DRJ42_09080 [Deltaproteobacteria bacterium]|nr:MAG: hypothetical protein DRJ42_09080 [Deltaproteobacteria bacterium]